MEGGEFRAVSEEGEEIGEIPDFDVGSVLRLGELFGGLRLFGQQEEKDEGIEVLVQPVLDGLSAVVVILAAAEVLVIWKARRRS